MSSNPQAILVVSQSGTEIYQELQASSKIQHLIVDLLPDPQALLHQLSQKQYHLLLIDLEALNPPGLLSQFFLELEARVTGVIVLAPPEGRSQAIKLLQYGASDYLLYPIDAT